MTENQGMGENRNMPADGYFLGLALPDELVKLIEFHNRFGMHSYYSSGFDLKPDPEKRLLRTYSESPDFLNAWIPFADADEAGAGYAFWLGGGARDLGEAPIVIFGGEGGHHVVARNMREFLGILVHDTAPWVDWNEVSYCKDPGDVSEDGLNLQFRAWALDNFRIDASTSADEIVRKAQEEFGEAFDGWMRLHAEQ